MGKSRRLVDLIDLMAVPSTDFRNVYLLGNFARHVTIYSQQVRAINLVEALYETKKLDTGTKVAIIGAGIAGITCAVAALYKGAEVSIIESEFPEAMGLQGNCEHRTIHPFIYDWPDYRNLGDESNLPFMNWKFGKAKGVIKALRDEWNQVRTAYKSQIKNEIYSASNIQIKGYTAEDEVIVAWEKDGGSDEGEFDILILAVGFGIEPQNKYWEDIAPHIEKGKKVLISGHGDGALTDAMRMAINDFDHYEVLQHFINDPTAISAANSIKKIEQRVSDDKREIHLKEAYKSFDIPALKTVLEPKIRKDISVFILSSINKLYSSKSSRLNRLIISQLVKMGAIKIKDRNHIDEAILIQGKDEYWVKYQKGANEKVSGDGDIFNIVIKKHGPDSALFAGFPKIDKASESLKSKWKQMSYDNDFTRKALWGKNSFKEPWHTNISVDQKHTFTENIQRIWNYPDADTKSILVIGAGSEKEAKDEVAAYDTIETFIDQEAILDTITYLARIYPYNTNPKRVTQFVKEEDLKGTSLILVGGPIEEIGKGGNKFAEYLNEKIGSLISYNIEEGKLLIKSTNETFDIKYTSGQITTDYGIIMRFTNPWDENQIVLSFQGIESVGTLGAVLALTSPTVCVENAEKITKKIGSDTSFFYAIVEVSVQNNIILAPEILEKNIFKL